MFIFITLFLRCETQAWAEGVEPAPSRDRKQDSLQTPVVGRGSCSWPQGPESLCLSFLISPGHGGGRDIRGQDPRPQPPEEKRQGWGRRNGHRQGGKAPCRQPCHGIAAFPTELITPCDLDPTSPLSLRSPSSRSPSSRGSLLDLQVLNSCNSASRHWVAQPAALCGPG